MSFPTSGTSRVGIDTAGDMSGAAYNTDGSAKVEWATLLNSIISNGTVNTNAVAPTSIVSGSFTQANTSIHPFAAVSTPCGSKITVVADSANNAAGVLVGGAAPAFPLYPGQSVTIAVNDLANVYYQFGAHAGDKIYYIQSA
jgi:hypothetical protein